MARRKKENDPNRVKTKEAIAQLWLKRFSVRQITAALEQQGIKQANGKPYSRSAVQIMTYELRTEWKQEYLEDVDMLIGERLHKLYMLEQQILNPGLDNGKKVPINIEDFCRIHDRIVRLLGIEKPMRIDLSSNSPQQIEKHVPEDRVVEIFQNLGISPQYTAKDVITIEKVESEPA